MPDSLRIFLNRLRKLSSLADQVLVSGGNFLTIAICAHTLSLAEQGKFTYIFASYIALLLLNVAGIFQGAAVRAPALEHHAYKITLARLQLLQAFMLSLMVSGVWWAAGNVFGWQATGSEAWLLFIFLFLQQLADFDRRSAYIFLSVKRVIFSSAILYPSRILGLLAFQPNTVSEVLVILIVTALTPAAITVFVACQSDNEGKKTWMNAAKEHLSYSRLFIAGIPLVWLSAYIPVFMLGAVHGKEQVAILGSIRGLTNIANILMEQLETKVVADWARMHQKGGVPFVEAATTLMLKIGIVFWLIGIIAILLWGSEIIYFVLGAQYVPYWNLLVINWIAYGIYFLVRISGIKHRAQGKSKVEFVGNVAGVVVAAVAAFTIIPAYGTAGAAWAYAAMCIAALALQTYSAKKLT